MGECYSFCGCVIFHWTYMPYLLCLFVSSWAFGFFPLNSYCKQCSYEHLSMSFFKTMFYFYLFACPVFIVTCRIFSVAEWEVPEYVFVLTYVFISPGYILGWPRSLGFSITAYGKTQTNFLAKPILRHLITG